MKPFLILIAALFTLTAKSQTSVYYPFPDSAAVWNVDYSDFAFACSNLYPHHERFSYVITGDTVIGIQSYHKIAIAGSVTLTYFDTCKFFHAGYVGSIRQDTTIKKVFFVESMDTTEKLLYDFNMQVGDTLTSYPAICYGATITSIDSVLINGNYRERWEWQDMYADTGFILEGIGSTWGLLQPLCEFISGPVTYLACFKQNNLILYIDTNATTDCDIINSLTSLPNKLLSLIISPNPFNITALLHVNSGFESSTLKIYNSLGLLISEICISNQKTFLLSRNKLDNGIYFVQLINSQGQTTMGKFLVN